MKKILTTLAITGALLGSIQSTQAAWVVGASTVASDSDFSAEVDRIAYRAAVISFIGPAITGSSVFAGIFILGDDGVNNQSIAELKKSFPTLAESDLFSDLTRKIQHTLSDATLVDADQDEKGNELEKHIVSFDSQEIMALLEKHGHDTNSKDAKKLMESFSN